MPNRRDRLVVCAFGNSLTQGFGLKQDQAFPHLLQTRLDNDHQNARVINAGVSGNTSRDGLMRIDYALAEDPDVVIVELGANDAFMGIDPGATEANLDEILTRVKRQTDLVLLAGFACPPVWGREYAHRFNSMFPRLAEKHGAVLYPDIQAGLDQGMHFLPDGVHPNADGAKVVADGIYPLAARLVEKARNRA